jgi:hypothetical protein
MPPTPTLTEYTLPVGIMSQALWAGGAWPPPTALFVNVTFKATGTLGVDEVLPVYVDATAPGSSVAFQGCTFLDNTGVSWWCASRSCWRMRRWVRVVDPCD